MWCGGRAAEPPRSAEPQATRDAKASAGGALVRLEHHLLALAREDLDQLHAAVTQPHVRRLHPGRRARQHRVFVAPVEPVGLARIEDQRHIGLGRRQQPVPAPPDPGIAAHRVVAALIAQRRKVFMNPQQRQPIPARLLLVGLQLALKLIHPRSKLRHRLDLALVAVRGLIAPHHLAHCVLRNPQIPGDRLGRNAPHQMIPTDPCDRFHYQHLPLTSSVQ